MSTSHGRSAGVRRLSAAMPAATSSAALTPRATMPAMSGS